MHVQKEWLNYQEKKKMNNLVISSPSAIIKNPNMPEKSMIFFNNSHYKHDLDLLHKVLGNKYLAFRYDFSESDDRNEYLALKVSTISCCKNFRTGETKYSLFNINIMYDLFNNNIIKLNYYRWLSSKNDFWLINKIEAYKYNNVKIVPVLYQQLYNINEFLTAEELNKKEMTIYNLPKKDYNEKLVEIDKLKLIKNNLKLFPKLLLEIDPIFKRFIIKNDKLDIYIIRESINSYFKQKYSKTYFFNKIKFNEIYDDSINSLYNY